MEKHSSKRGDKTEDSIVDILELNQLQNHDQMTMALGLVLPLKILNAPVSSEKQNTSPVFLRNEIGLLFSKVFPNIYLHLAKKKTDDHLKIFLGRRLKEVRPNCYRLYI